MTLPPPLRAILTHAIDYAGLFPPAGLPLQTVVANYMRYMAGADAWALGPLVLPARALIALDGHVAAATPPTPGAATGPVLPVSVTVTRAWRDEWAPLEAYLAQDEALGRVVALEVPVDDADGVRAVVEAAAGRFPVYVEVPVDERLDLMVQALARFGALGKVRTGGVQPAAIPSAASVARFVAACTRECVPFKATAGLHEALRGVRPLTYAPESPCAPMHGYLNLFVATAVARRGNAPPEIDRILAGPGSDPVVVDEEGLSWGPYRFETAELDALRRTGMTSFGSCSFDEPLASAHALPRVPVTAPPSPETRRPCH